MMGRSTAQVRANGLIRELVAETYGSPASPAVYYCECGHPDFTHKGEDWEGACADCGCTERRDRE